MIIVYKHIIIYSYYYRHELIMLNTNITIMQADMSSLTMVMVMTCRDLSVIQCIALYVFTLFCCLYYLL